MANADMDKSADETPPQTSPNLNALKHGLTSKSVVLPSESNEEFESLRAAVLDSFNPLGFSENELVDRMISSAWRLRRVLTIELNLFKQGSSGVFPFNSKESIGETFARQVDLIGKLTKYEAHLLKQFNRANFELQSMRNQQEEKCLAG